MSRETTKLIVTSSVLVIFIAILVCLCIFGVDLGFLNIPSVSTILSQKNQIDTKQKEYTQTQSKYTSTLQNLETAKSDYQKEKTKYETISDDTIKIIKEATTEENYNIEYMWIKLGNYAKANNLSLVVVEPGGTSTSATTAATTGTAATTSGTTTGTTTNTSTTTSNTTTGATTSTNTSSTTNTSGTSTNTNTTGTNTTTTSSSDEMKIELTGSYIDVSDFIFEVENDAQLKFKLDNISITYVEGTTIKTTFVVKQMKIKK